MGWESLPNLLTADLREQHDSATGASLRREATTAALMATWYQDPRDVRASQRYGANVTASGYHITDANGMSIGIVKDVLRMGKARASTVRPAPVKVSQRQDRAAAERLLAGTIRMGDMD